MTSSASSTATMSAVQWTQYAIDTIDRLADRVSSALAFNTRTQEILATFRG